MSLISNLIRKIFGNSQGEDKHTTPSIRDYMYEYERERAKRNTAIEARLRGWIITFLKEKGTLMFSWESGGDEGFVSFQDGNYNEEKFQDLEEYIIDKLEIPSAGEFQMNGNGIIYLEDKFIKVKYSSIMKALIDFNEETEEEIYSEEELDSGEMVLFSI